MPECCVGFIMFYKFSQIRKNDDRQSGQLQVTFRPKQDFAAIQDNNFLIHFRLKSQ